MFRAHWVLCSSGFSSQLIAALVGLQQETRGEICREIIACNSRDTMNLEALARFLNVFMDQYSPEALLSFFGSEENQSALLETLLVLNYYEAIRDVLLRILNDLPESMTPLKVATNQFLYQLAPKFQGGAVKASDSIQSRIAQDQPHQVFSRMLFTCDLLTDLIHERRTGTVGFYYVTEISSRPEFASWLIDAALQDLKTLPTAFANESYAVKVLNSLLQQSQCGCVTKAAFLTSSSALDDEQLTQGSPHDDLPVVWKHFITRLPEFLAILQFPQQKHFKTIHVQMIYLMLPILNVSCTAVDRHLIRSKTMECVLELITRFPAANILHCAISRLYIVALEDSPFMFGKELPAYRAANDPLRLHLLLQGCFETVLSVFGSEQRRRKPPPAFLDIAISFDQALTSAQAHSPRLLTSERMAQWYDFRSKVLLPTQTLWEEQYEPPAAPRGPKRVSVAELFDPASQLSLPVQAVPTQAEEAERISMLQRAIAAATEISISTPSPPAISLATEVSGSPTAGMSRLDSFSLKAARQATPVPAQREEEAEGNVLEDVPTPLAALYNDEEKHLMLKVASSEALLASSSSSADQT